MINTNGEIECIWKNAKKETSHTHTVECNVAVDYEIWNNNHIDYFNWNFNCFALIFIFLQLFINFLNVSIRMYCLCTGCTVSSLLIKFIGFVAVAVDSPRDQWGKEKQQQSQKHRRTSKEWKERRKERERNNISTHWYWSWDEIPRNDWTIANKWKKWTH